MSPDHFCDQIEIDAPTMDRLRAYVSLLESWQNKINLVSRNSMTDVWRRHVLDSAQLYQHLPAGTRSILDIGSGAGFPGLVLAILAGSAGSVGQDGPFVHLVESDGRKCAFLAEAARLTGARIKLHHCRIEALTPFAVDVITARALASVDKLLGLAWPFLSYAGEKQHKQDQANERSPVCLFQKGRKAEEELTAAQKQWNMSVRRIQSGTDSSGVILKIESVQHRDRKSQT